MNPAPARILIVDDEPNLRATLRMTLESEGHRVSEAASGEEAIGRAARGGIDLVLLDVRMPGIDGLETLERLRDRDPELPVVVMSGHGTIETAVQALQLGALDFLEKPLGAERVTVVVANALARDRLERENRDLRAQVEGDHQLVGDAPSMRALRDTIDKVAPTEGRVLILGASGTGKELVARAIHAASARREQPFVVMNCAAVPGELIESELFGHEKGAFTGAAARRRGRFELADRGTLFLDEIGDMPLAMQPKLLRVLEDGRFERVGGGEPIQVDVRIIAATNQDLEARVREGTFRADLYHRLNVVPIVLEPLAARRADLPLLVRHFMERITERHGRQPLAVDGDALELLATHAWPGNVRELRNTVERLVILADGPRLTAAEVRRLVPHLVASPAAPGDEPLDLRAAVRAFETRHIERVIRGAGGVMAEAARQLGIERSYLYKKMRDLGMERPGDASPPA
ncbi:MAG: sigma-54 dependent transcriptional regulator [Candidatus Eiseniibacteriota bacterium]